MNKNMIKTAVASVFITIALAGCGSTSEPIKAQAPVVTQTTTKAPVVLDATASAKKIEAKVPSVNKVVTITEANDENNLIGRPNGYTSAALLFDSRVKCDKGETQTWKGSCAEIEMFASVDAAQRRAAYIQGILKAAPILGNEYDYLNGNALLRIVGTVKPSVARQYNKAFGGTLQ